MMHLLGGESTPGSGPWGRHHGVGPLCMRWHGERGARGRRAFVVGRKQRATLLPTRINHCSDLLLILTISLSGACQRCIYSASKESTLLPGEGHLLFLGEKLCCSQKPVHPCTPWDEVRDEGCSCAWCPHLGTLAGDSAQRLLLQGSS